MEFAKGKTFEDVLLDAGADKIVVSDAARVLKSLQPQRIQRKSRNYTKV